MAGELISPRRWYWAVITAFVVFIGTSSRGEVLVRGWQRVLGTLAGVGGDAIVAALVSGNVAVSVTLILACLFCGFYLVQVSYGLMTFFIITVLALLYGILGQFNLDVLLLRLEETTAGAAIGILVAACVLPTATRDTVRDKASAFLGGLAELVEHGASQLAGRRTGGDLHRQARELDSQLQELRQVARPLTRGPLAGLGRSEVRRALLMLLACGYHARNLARVVERAGADDVVDAAALGHAADRVCANITSLRRRADGEDPAPLHPADQLITMVDARPGPARTALAALRAIDATADRLGGLLRVPRSVDLPATATRVEHP